MLYMQIKAHTNGPRDIPAEKSSSGRWAFLTGAAEDRDRGQRGRCIYQETEAPKTLHITRATMLVNSLTGNILLNHFLISIDDVSIDIGTVFALYSVTNKYVNFK